MKTFVDLGGIMLRIAICDDNKAIVDYLYRQINNTLQGEHIDFVVDTYTNGEKLKRSHLQNAYDILFLDICMPTVSGFDIAELIRSLSTKTAIVFVTSNEHLVFESFNYQPFYFIRKTTLVSMQLEIEQTLKKLLKLLRRHTVIEFFSVEEGLIYAVSTDILYVESRGHYLHYRMVSGKTIVVRGKISEAESKLATLEFLRIHKSYIVNMYNILTIDKGKNELVVAGNHRLRIGRLYEPDVTQSYKEFIRRSV